MGNEQGKHSSKQSHMNTTPTQSQYATQQQQSTQSNKQLKHQPSSSNERTNLVDNDHLSHNQQPTTTTTTTNTTNNDTQRSNDVPRSITSNATSDQMDVDSTNQQSFYNTTTSTSTTSSTQQQPSQQYRQHERKHVDIENYSNTNLPTDDDFVSLTSPYKKLSVDDFELLKVIGKGSFGKVMQVRKKSSNKIYAMKILKKDILLKRRQILHTKTERKILEEIHNPFITGLKYAFQTSTKLYLVMEYFAGGELFFHLKQCGKFTEDRAKFYAAEIMLAIECLHSKCIVYRDLKPENVLLDHDGHIRLTDFGLAKDGVSNIDCDTDVCHPTRTFCGTPEYLAPEMIARLPYGLCVDWWSLGTLLYEMLTGLPPFYDSNLHIMYEKIVRSKLHIPSYLTPSCQSLLQGLLERDPKKRLGYAHDGADLRSHPWFSNINWDAMMLKQISVPFKPKNVGGEMDTQNVDDEFKRLPAADTPSASLRTKVNFEGMLTCYIDSIIQLHCFILTHNYVLHYRVYICGINTKSTK